VALTSTSTCDPSLAAVLPLGVHRRGRFGQLLQPGVDSLARVVDEVVHAQAQRLAVLVAEQSLQCRIGIDDPLGLEIDEVDSLGRLLHHGAVALFVLPQHFLAEPAVGVAGVHDVGAPPDDQVEQDDVGQDEERDAGFGVEQVEVFAAQDEPAEQRGDQQRRGDEAARHGAAQRIADERADRLARRPRAQEPDAHERERDGGIQRHRDVSAHPVQRHTAIQVSREREQRHATRSEDQDLRGVVALGRALIEHEQGEADQQERRGGVGRHDVSRELRVEQPLVDPIGPAQPVGCEAPHRDERQHGAARLRDVHARHRGRLLAQHPDGQRAQEEPRGGHRVHRDALGVHEALEHLDVERPAHEDERGNQRDERGDERGGTCGVGAREGSCTRFAARVFNPCMTRQTAWVENPCHEKRRYDDTAT
jgi:hypothetical protein